MILKCPRCGNHNLLRGPVTVTDSSGKKINGKQKGTLCKGCGWKKIQDIK